MLHDTYDEQRHAHLIICAAPAFLGNLRPHLSKNLVAHVQLELDRDWTQKTPAELETALQRALKNRS